MNLTGLTPMAECALHEGVAATGTCERCGRFFCSDDVANLGSAQFCTECAARPEVIEVYAFRNKYERNESGLLTLAFFLGLSFLALGAVIVLEAMRKVIESASLLNILSLTSGGVGLAISGTGLWSIIYRAKRTDRKILPAFAIGAVLFVPLCALVDAPFHALFWPLVFASVFAFIARHDVPMRLYYRRPVTDAEIQALLHRYPRDDFAYSAALVSLATPCCPLISFVALALVISGLAKTKRAPTQHAVFAIVVSLLSWPLWFFILVRSGGPP